MEKKVSEITTPPSSISRDKGRAEWFSSQVSVTSREETHNTESHSYQRPLLM
jgi:hypothetical protein